MRKNALYIDFKIVYLTEEEKQVIKLAWAQEDEKRALRKIEKERKSWEEKVLNKSLMME